VLGDRAAAEAAAARAAARREGRLELAAALRTQGDEPAALAELQRLRTDPQLGTAAARLLAQQAMERGEYSLAEERCQALLPDTASAPLAVYFLGLIAERRGDTEQAERNYALLAGTAFESQGRHRAAVMLYREGEHAAAARLLAEIAVADLLSESGAHEDAVKRIDAALAHSPGHPDLAYQRAVLLERAGRIDDAVQVLEALHRERPQDATSTNALGYTLADHKRDLPRAAQLVREALAAEPDNPAMLDSLGWVLYRRGDAAGAVRELARAYRLLQDGDIGAHLGEAQWVAGRKDDARATWRRALAADPDNTLLAATVKRYAPGLKAPVPPPATAPGPRTSV
jgi:tetratricopeptide (TPR) repeat protein